MMPRLVGMSFVNQKYQKEGNLLQIILFFCHMGNETCKYVQICLEVNGFFYNFAAILLEKSIGLYGREDNFLICFSRLVFK